MTTTKADQVRANRDVSVSGLAEVYVLRNIALVDDDNGKALPGLAQVAKQEGQYFGKASAQRLRNGMAARDFKFHNRGNMAVIGRHAAVADFGWMQLKGTLAWLLWALVHIYLRAGLQYRLLVAVQWAWRYITTIEALG